MHQIETLFLPEKFPAAQLRADAEAKLARAPPGAVALRPGADLLHELQVHQIELEMQNEALRQANLAMEESRDHYADLYEFAPVGYFTLSREGIIEQLNRVGASMLGEEQEKLLRTRFARFVITRDRDRWYRHLARVMRHRDKLSCEMALFCGKVNIRHVRLDCLCIAADDGAIAVRVGLIDVTERKLAEEALSEARDATEQENLAKSAFLANMSHEIRTPLHNIIGLGHLLRHDVTDAVQLQRLDDLATSSDHLLAIINDVLDLSKIEARQLALDHNEFRLDTVVDKVTCMLGGRAHEKGLTLRVDVAPRLDGMALTGDALRLTQVLINLCSNAVKFTEQGAVRLRIDCLAEDAAGVTLRFAVEDTGIGIPPVEQARMFQPFAQADNPAARKDAGTGLGLAISQRLVALMGGKITVESRPGAGSTFRFELVLPRATAGVAAVPAAPAAADFCGSRVLLVEDHPLSQEILWKMLEDLGCAGEVATDGAAAVERARERSYDLILMDMQMPGMDGLAATRAVRALPGHRDTPIIALTANAFADDRQRCLDAGMNGHLGKPVTPATLATALGQWLLPNRVPGLRSTWDTAAGAASA